MSQNTSKDDVHREERDYSGVVGLVEQLAGILGRSDLTEIRIRDGTFEVQISRVLFSGDGNGRPLSLRAPESVAAGEVSQSPLEGVGAAVGAESDRNVFINAPMPSRFYRSPGPDEPPFVKVGDTVSIGEPVAVLEVMKTYNPVEAPFNCEILEVLAEDGDAVEYFQPLFRVKAL